MKLTNVISLELFTFCPTFLYTHPFSLSVFMATLPTCIFHIIASYVLQE